MKKIVQNKVLLTQIFLIILFLTTWEILSSANIINSFIFSSPSKIASCFYTLLISGDLFYHIWVTTYEVLISFVLGITGAFIISVLMYQNKFFAKVIDPFLSILNSLPKVALGPIIIIWAGANMKSIITMALLTNIIISILNIYTGFINTDEVKIKLFKTFKASKWQILFKLVIPENLPVIVNTLKVNMSLTFIGVIMGEFLVSKAGIGYLILYGTQVFNLNLVLTGIFIIMILSYAVYRIICIFEKKFKYEG